MTETVLADARLPTARLRRKSIRAHFREGIEAALRTDPLVLATCKTRTACGLLVRELVLEACRGKTPALKVMLSLDSDESEQQVAEAQATSSPGELQGLKQITAGTEPRWDWNADGNWESQPEPESEPDTSAPVAEASSEIDRYKRMLRRKLERMNEAQQAEGAEEAKQGEPEPASGS